MGTFKNGDRVVNSNGDFATVVDSREFLSVNWDAGVYGIHPACAFELVARKFKAGDFVRVLPGIDDTSGEVGIIFEDDGEPEDQDPYWVALFNANGDEEPYSADELEPWLPLVGERVIESEVDDDEEGTVISINAVGTEGGVDDVSVRVLWDSFPLAQDWLLSDLEPVDKYEDDEIEVGDTVKYYSPIFAGPIYAEVVKDDGNLLEVVFHNNYFPKGNYSKELFSKAA